MKKKAILGVLCLIFLGFAYLIYKHSPLSPTHNIITLPKTTFRVTESISAKVAAPADKVQASVVGISGQAVDARITEKESQGETTLLVEPPVSFQPGKYSLTVESEGKTYKQDFTWGVLAINSNKSIYAHNEKARLSFAVLDEKGMMVCDASVKLIITSPTNTKEELSTGNRRIKANPECQVKDLVTNPDYEAEYQLGISGTYKLSLTATTKNGIYTIDDEILVSHDTPAFDIERESATRIYPIHKYPVKLTITANQDFDGEISERVPLSFKIDNLEKTSKVFAYTSFNKNTTQNYQYQDIIWKVNLKKGDTITLGYTYDAPDKSPYFFLAGPLRFTSESTEIYKENRAWQIAVDDVASTLQQQINIVDQEYESTSNSFAPTDNSLGLVKFDGSKYNHESVYFEAVMEKEEPDEINGDVGASPSIYCVTTSNCKVVFVDESNFGIRLKNCSDAACTEGTITIIDGDGCALSNCNSMISAPNDTAIYCISSIDCKIAYKSGLQDLDLYFVDCDDENCTSGTRTKIDGGSGCTLTGCATSGGPGAYTTLDCSNGSTDCKIIYTDSDDLMFADCDDTACGTGTRTILDGRSSCTLTGCSSSIAIRDPRLSCIAGSDDCKIAYHDHTNGDLYFADCANATCSSGSRTLLDGNTGCTLTGCSTTSSSGDSVGLYCVSATDCKVVYIDDTGDDVYFADCDNASCSSGTRTILDGGTSCALTGCSTSTTFTPQSLSGINCAAGTDNCKLIYYSVSASDIFFADCANATCSSGTRSVMDGGSGCSLTDCSTSATVSPYGQAITCLSDTDCKIAYSRNITDQDLYFADCDNAACTSGTISYVDGNGPGRHTIGRNATMSCPTADNCKIAYYDETNASLRFIDCDDDSCSTGTHVILDGASGCVLTGCTTSAAQTGAVTTMNCPSSDDCKILYMRSSISGYFVDCNSETCNTGTTNQISGLSLSTSTTISLDCSNGSADCKGATISGSGILTFFDCANATCSSASTKILRGNGSCVITGCSTTATTLDVSVDCIAGTDDCKVALYDGSNSDLYFIDCDAADCGSGTQSILDGGTSCTLTNCVTSGTTIGSRARIKCFSASDCKIAYLRSADIYFADCDNATCSSGTTTLIDGASGCTLTGCSTSGSYSPNTMGFFCSATDDCKVTYYSGDLFFADCDTATCSSGTRTLLDGNTGCVLTNCVTSTAAGFNSSVDCTGGSADCKVAYYDFSNLDLRFADCANQSCSSGSIRIIDNKSEIVFAQLYNSSGTAVVDGILSMQSGTGFQRLRSSNSLNLDDDTDYTVRIHSSDNSGKITARLKAARLIIPQNGSFVTDTQTQIEIGNNETTDNTSFTPLTSPKIINFNPGKYSDEPEVYFEATIKNSGANTTSVILSTNATCTNTIEESEITTTGTSWSLVRTDDSIADMLTSSDYYVCVKTSAGTASIANAKIVINQSNPSGLGYLQLYHTLANTLVTDSDSTYTDHDFLNAIYTGSYTGGYQTEAYYEATIKTSAGTGYTRLKNDSDNQTINNSAINTTNTSYTRVRSSNIFSDLPTTIKNLDIQTSNSATNTTSVAGSWVIIEFVPPPPQIEGNNFQFEGVGFD